MMVPQPVPILERTVLALSDGDATFEEQGSRISASLRARKLDLLQEHDTTWWDSWAVGRMQQVEPGQTTFRAFWRGLACFQARRVAAALLQAGLGSESWLPTDATLPDIPETLRISIMRYLVRDLPMARIGVVGDDQTSVVMTLAWQERELAIHPAITRDDSVSAWTVTSLATGLPVLSTIRLVQARAASVDLQEVCNDWSHPLAEPVPQEIERIIRQYRDTPVAPPASTRPEKRTGGTKRRRGHG